MKISKVRFEVTYFCRVTISLVSTAFNVGIDYFPRDIVIYSSDVYPVGMGFRRGRDFTSSFVECIFSFSGRFGSITVQRQVLNGKKRGHVIFRWEFRYSIHPGLNYLPSIRTSGLNGSTPGEVDLLTGGNVRVVFFNVLASVMVGNFIRRFSFPVYGAFLTDRDYPGLLGVLYNYDIIMAGLLGVVIRVHGRLI